MKALFFFYEDPSLLPLTGGILHTLEVITRLVQKYNFEIFIITTNHFHHSLSREFFKEKGVLNRLNILYVKIPNFPLLRLRSWYFTLKGTLKTISTIYKKNLRVIVGGGQDTPTTLLPAFLAKFLLGKSIRVIYFSQLPVKGFTQKRYAKLLANADAIIVPTDIVKESLQSYLSKRKTFYTVGNGLSLPEKIPRVKGKDNDCIFVGRITKDKGALDLIKISNLVKQARKGTRFVAVGDMSKEVKSYIDKHKCSTVEFTGFIPYEKLYEYLARSNLFVYPSKYDSFALSVAEAMYMGLPVMVWDIPPFNQVYKECKGIVRIKPFEHELFANKIIELLSDTKKLKYMGRRNKLFIKRFDWNEVANRWSKNLKQI